MALIRRRASWILFWSATFVMLGSGTAVAQTTGQVLYNGITLPQQWPPIGGPSQAYQVPSYITNPPAVIPIDIGRQLFVDDFLIQQSTMTRTQHQPLMYPGNPILGPNALDTTGNAFPYSDGVWFDPADKTFKMWFYCGSADMICYAYSADGKNWIKPVLPNAVVPNTDEVLQIDPARDSATVWMDLHDPNPANKFKLFVFNGYGMLTYFSPDGIKWVGQGQYNVGILKDRTTLFWNPFRSVWVDSLKNYLTIPPSGNRPGYVSRVRYYAESPDLIHWTPSNFLDSFWTGPDVNDPPYVSGGVFPQLYNLDGVAYESLIVGLFNWYYPGPAYPSDDPNGLPGPALVELGAGFSRDGFQWVRPTRGSGPSNAFIPASNIAGTWNMGNTQSAGGGFLVVGDELWFYFSGRNGPHGVSKIGSTGLATLRRDGFYSMDAGSTEAELTTRPVKFSGKYLFVNVNDPTGQLLVEATDANGNVIQPFSKANCVAVSVNKTLQQVTWTGAADLSSLAGRSVKFNFYLTSGSLYSFWVTVSASGASNGYVAAMGPGFTGPTDTLGSAAYPPVSVTPGSVVLNQGQSQQFLASISLEAGTSQAVSWSISPNVGSISTNGLYMAPATIIGAPMITITATSTADVSKFGTASVQLATLASASFIASDATTKGSWKGIYGVDGSSISNDSQGLPSYATLTFQNPFTWNNSTTDPRALQTRSGTGTGRIASTWFNYPTETLDVNFTDGAPHQFAIYLLDWDSMGRSESIQVRDAASNALLDSRNITNFSGGVYLSWTLSGHVTINAVLLTGPNAVIGGAFFGGSGGSGSGGSGGGGGTVSVSVTPQTVSLTANQTQPFTASVQNSTNQAVVWSINPQVGTIAPSGSTVVYTAPALITGAQPVSIIATSAVGPVGNATINLAPGAAANFVGNDTATQGNWQGVYGSDGYSVANNVQSIPGYAAFATSNQSVFTWNGAPTDARALLTGSGSNRIASTWYSSPSFSFDINFQDGNSHRLALYALDWDVKGRVETILVQDATSGVALDTRQISGFSNGIYLIWNITGHVKINVILNGGPNAVVSGVFFGNGGNGLSVSPASVTLSAGQNQPFSATLNGVSTQQVTWGINPSVGSISSAGIYTAPTPVTTFQSVTVTATAPGSLTAIATVNLTSGATANFLRSDTTTQGSWMAVYGVDGYSVVNGLQHIPTYATFALQNQSPYTWSLSPTDPRALQTGNGTARTAATWYGYPAFNFDINFTDGAAHQFELYALDWDSKGRVETIQVLDASSNAVLDSRSISSFANGTYLVWTISGHVKILVTLTSGPNAVIGGAFFK